MNYYNSSITFPDNLRNARTKAGYTQSSLAEKLGMTRQNYSRYESSDLNAQPSLELLCELSHILGTTPNDLLGYNPQNINDIEYARKFLHDNFTEKDDNNIVYGCLTPEQIDDMHYKYDGKGPLVTIPKNIFIEFVKEARQDAEYSLQRYEKKFFKDDFIRSINRSILNYDEANGTH